MKVQTQVDTKEYFKEIHFLYEILFSLKSTGEVKLFLKDMLTQSELVMLKRRWHIASLLRTGLDIRAVAEETETSTTTVTRVKNVLENGTGGLQLALERAHKREVEDKERFLKQIKRKNSKMGGSTFVKGWFNS